MRFCSSHSTQWQKTRGALARQRRCHACFSLLKESSGVRPPSCLFPFPCWRAGRVTDTEGSQWRVWQPGIKPQQESATDWRAGGSMQRAVQAFIGPSPSHLSHKIGFVEALPSAEKGQSRLWGQARLKWNNQWNGAKYNAFLSECKSWLNYE